MKTIFYATTALCALISTQAWADDASNLDEVVVTANRAPEQLRHVGGQITLIDRAALDRQQALVVSDVLQRLPGISLSRNGGVGTATQLRIRGAETGQTAVVIDGVKLNDPSATDSGYNFANLLVGDIDRIEVLRGAQSVLWGSQAIGGVVNIITREPTKPFEANATAEVGSEKTASGRLDLGGKSDRVIWRAGAGYYTTDGVSAFNKARGGGEKDGDQNVSASGKAKVVLTDQLSLDVRGFYSRSRTQIDGFASTAPFAFGDSPEYSTTRDLVGYAGLNLDLLDGRFSNRVALGYTDTRRGSFNPVQAVTPVTFDAAGRNRRLEYQGTFKLTDAWTTVFGAESERSRFRTASPSAFTPKPVPGRRKASLDGIYGQVSGQVIPDLTLTGGIRHDDHGDFGGHTVGQASAAWTILQTTILRASWGQGFKAPSLYQLGSDFGNANLNPEEADSWDAGVEHRFADGKLVLSAAYFNRHTKSQIDFLSCTGLNIPLCFSTNGVRRSGYYDNIARSKAHGYELQATATPFEGLTLNANYTHTVSLNDVVGNVNFGKWLTRRPREQANLEASYDWPFKLSTSVAARYAGKSFDDVANRTLVKGYVLWDVRASYPVTETIEVYGRVENLFDKPYETIFRYGQPGRAAYAGVRARF